MATSMLSEFISGFSPSSIPDQVIDVTKTTVLDWLGSAYAGSSQPASQHVISVIRSQGGVPEANVIGTAERTSSLNAALANGTMSHVVELDDLHRESIVHPAAPIIPAALAVAQREHKSGVEFLAAIIVGYDVALRIGEAVNPSHYQRFHSTGTCGVFGAAAASSFLLSLDTEQVRFALGNAGTQAAALWQYLKDGDMSKSLHPGKAAMDGTLAALLAREGFTGAREILEGERGFAATMADDFHPEVIAEGLGEEFKILENSFKIHACCRHTHPAIDLAISLSEEHDLQADDIASVRIHTNRMTIEVTGDNDPASIYKAKFSMPFVVSLALIQRQAGLAEFTPARLHDPAVRSLMAKTTLIEDEGYSGTFPRDWSAHIEVTTKAGQVHSAVTHFAKGDPESPASDGEIRKKFGEMMSPLMSLADAAKVMDLTYRLHEIQDMSSIDLPALDAQVQAEMAAQL